MNASTKAAYLAPAVTGVLLFSGWFHTDTLQLDLYGSLPTEDDGYTVESVTVHGHTVDIVELFTASQIRNMGEYLDFKDDTNPTLRRHAADKRHDAIQGPFEKRF